MNKPFSIIDALQHAKGETVLAFDVNGKHHYGKLVVAYFQPMPHMILQCGDEQRIVMLNNCTSVMPNPKRAPGQLAGAAAGDKQAERAAKAQRVGAFLMKLMEG